jgi:hypothetical protein
MNGARIFMKIALHGRHYLSWSNAPNAPSVVPYENMPASSTC